MDILESKYKILEKKIGSVTTEDVERKIENEMLILKNNINNYKQIIYKNISIITGDITQEKIVDILANKESEFLNIITAEASELISHWNGRYNNQTIEIFLKAWEGSEYTALRATKSDSIISNPLLNLCLFTQPEVIQSLKSHEKRGLPQRFLIINGSKPPVEDFLIFYEADSEVEKIFNSNINRLSNMSEEVDRTIIIPSTSRQAFEGMYKDIYFKSRDEDKSNFEQEWIVKAIGNIIKVVSLLKVANEIENGNVAETIKLTNRDIKNMYKLYEYYESHFKKAFKLIKNNVIEEDLKYLFKRIIDLMPEHAMNGKINATIMNNYIPRFTSAERKILLKELEEFNLIKIHYKSRSMLVELNNEIKKMSSEKAIKAFFEDDYINN